MKFLMTRFAAARSPAAAAAASWLFSVDVNVSWNTVIIVKQSWWKAPIFQSTLSIVYISWMEASNRRPWTVTSSWCSLLLFGGVRGESEDAGGDISIPAERGGFKAWVRDLSASTVTATQRLHLMVDVRNCSVSCRNFPGSVSSDVTDLSEVFSPDLCWFVD